MIILGIETSCDDTAVSVIKKNAKTLTSLSHIHYSQIKTHKQYGGVIPEVAAREHTVTIIPTLHTALARAHITEKNIDLIAVTQGPGLSPSLSVGIDTARILSQLHNIPLIGISHVEGHIASVWPINKITKSATHAPALPALALVVSGGHTELIRITKFGSYVLLGKTRDDAAGEAFDKVATLLGLPYPGGPEISKYGKKGKRNAFDFPRPMMHDASFDFSFAGLKTAVRYAIEKQKKLSIQCKRDMAASFEQAVVDVLVSKTIHAHMAKPIKNILLVGGVSANTLLRKTLTREFKKLDVPVHLAPPNMTQDNATMIAMVAALKNTKGSRTAWKTMHANPNWHITKK